jgi:hypothetical protein
MRVWEVQAAGSMPLEAWYTLSLTERAYRVAAMLVPMIQGSLQTYDQPIRLGKR